MNIIQFNNKANLNLALDEIGVHEFIFQGMVGDIEGQLIVPKMQQDNNYIAIIGHPHSLYGGSMQNKVVTTVARTCRDAGISNFRCNFRGVGNSQGCFDNGIGESEDLLKLVDGIRSEKPNSKFLLIGFSFGSYVTYRASAQLNAELLISIAPPVTHFDYHEFLYTPEKWHIIQGVNDDVVKLEDVLNFSNTFSPKLTMHIAPEAGHFFHGQLLFLSELLLKIFS